MRALILGVLLAAAVAPVWAQEEPRDEIDAAAAAAAMLGKLHFVTGDIALPEASATLHVDDSFRYLAQADARTVLEDLWGNPPDESILGLLVPKSPELLDEHAWAVVVTYSDDGYVSDEEAAEIDYSALLAELQTETRDSNEARTEAGYETIDLVGWAAPPRYDAGSNKLYWAKELAFEGTPEHTLNYEVRALGRKGYLSLNAVANMSDLQAVESGMQKVLSITEFNEGARYGDFDSSSDKVAGYGIAALVGGALAAKAGLFGKLAVLLVAGKKFVILGLVGIAALLGKLFKAKKAGEKA